MLSLARENAPDHIQDPAFQQDLLEAVEDALRRVDRVHERLSMLKGEITPADFAIFHLTIIIICACPMKSFFLLFHRGNLPAL